MDKDVCELLTLIEENKTALTDSSYKSMLEILKQIHERLSNNNNDNNLEWTDLVADLTPTWIPTPIWSLLSGIYTPASTLNIPSTASTLNISSTSGFNFRPINSTIEILGMSYTPVSLPTGMYFPPNSVLYRL